MITQSTLYEGILQGKKRSGAKLLVPSFFQEPGKNGIQVSLPPKWLLAEDESAGKDLVGTNALPPFLLALHQERGSERTRESLKAFELLSLAARHHFLVSRGIREERDAWGEFGPGNTCEAKDLAAAVREAAANIRSGKSAQADTPGLKLVGIKIKGDLDLSKLSLPFSIRLIGCWIDGALLLDRTTLSTLDLSGSVVTKGASCNYFETRGALRIRRTVFSGPLDLGGAMIRATLDASDCMVVPKFLPPASVAFVGDRHALNLSLATIEKEARFNRARIYGGMNLRGSTVNGAFFLDDAIIYAPVAMAELLLFDEWKARDGDVSNAPGPIRACLIEWEACKRKEASIVALVRSADTVTASPGNVELESLAELEAWTVPRGAETGASEALAKLVCEHPVSSYHALRAEGCRISGVLKARSCLFQGAVKFKSAYVGDRMTFNGSWFRRVALGAVLGNADRLACSKSLEQVAREFTSALHLAEDTEPSNREAAALDLRDCDLHGTLDLRKDNREILHDGVGTEELVGSPNWRMPLVAPLIGTILERDPDPFKLLPLVNPSQANIFTLWQYGKVIGEPDSVPLGRQKRLLDAARQLFESSPDGEKDIIYLQKVAKLASCKSPSRLEDLTELERPRARLEAAGSHPIEKFRNTAESDGLLASTIIAGEIDLSGATVRGGVRARYAIMNVAIGAQQDCEFRLLNARISGSLDLRNTVGFCYIDAKQARIGGSLRLVETPRQDAFLSRTGPLRQRASLTFFEPKAAGRTPRQTSLRFGRHRFEGARIGADALCLFDHMKGPSLDLRSARIGGALSILPALGGVELTDTEYFEDRIADQRNRAHAPYPSNPLSGLWARLAYACNAIAAAFSAVGTGRGFSLPSYASPFKTWLGTTNELVLKYQTQLEGQQYRATPAPRPIIDLRATRTVGFVHPPSAWPAQDGLRIDGFEYKLTSQVGPLVPARRTWIGAVADRKTNTDFLKKGLWVRIAILPLSIIGLGALALYMNAMDIAWETTPTAFWRAYMNRLRELAGLATPARIVDAAGPANTALIAVTFVSAGVMSLLQAHTAPPANSVSIRAVDWLKLQRRRLNTGKRHHMIYPFQPFIQAAEALRLAGRIRAANQVELERLRVRRHMLSFRRDAPLRLVLKVADVTMKYGYRPMRLTFVLWCLILIGSLVAKTAELNNRVTAAFDVTIDTESDHFGALQSTAYRQPSTPEFSPFLYSIDASLPFIDLGQEKNWKVRTTKLPGETNTFDLPYIIGKAFPCEPVAKVLSGGWHLVAAWYFSWARLLGWLLTAIVSVAVVARLEALISRNEG